ncbi:hypothetical protein [Streptomyces virginiae]|uniref:Uncharacterized protein n=1 Tax=Streptomyces virginiae TaxID=1961 RepID=A0ABZ1TR12_STRVG|nr:hypothetical protein [Streptomyces virginiae]
MTRPDQAGPVLTITSFGYVHQSGGHAPAAHLTLDLHAHFFSQ